MSNDEIESDELNDNNDQAPNFEEGQNESAYIASEEKTPISRGTIAMFVIMALAGAGTYFMYVRSGPQSASAAVNPQAQQVIKQFMTDRDKNFTLMQKMLRDTESVVKQFLTYPSVTQIPLAELRTNPFRAAPASADASTTPAQAKRDEEKEKKRKEEERVAVLRGVQAMQLQLVAYSDARKTCMINNTLFTEGQQVDQFLIEKINPNAVIVRNGAYRFELRIQK